jgi:hypothetical protein
MRKELKDSLIPWSTKAVNVAAAGGWGNSDWPATWSVILWLPACRCHCSLFQHNANCTVRMLEINPSGLAGMSKHYRNEVQVRPRCDLLRSADTVTNGSRLVFWRDAETLDKTSDNRWMSQRNLCDVIRTFPTNLLRSLSNLWRSKKFFPHLPTRLWPRGSGVPFSAEMSRTSSDSYSWQLNTRLLLVPKLKVSDV